MPLTTTSPSQYLISATDSEAYLNYLLNWQVLLYLNIPSEKHVQTVRGTGVYV